MIGRKIGPYEVVAKLGQGGMGEVYRAHDTKLGRDVALKVLPDLFAQDPERLARFRREAQVLASLNHPHIAQIYGIEDASGVTALAMELVDGGTLADRIARGVLPRDEALAIARQIAEALAAAHEHGIVHRDLKPANISVTDDGTVKVLDFGLAKALEPEGTSASGGALVTNSPTLTSPAATAMGMILGTAAYMAPEQAKGQRVDKRADIWAFGCVVYEMLTGKRAFEGDDVSEVLASVLAREPKLTTLSADTPPIVRTLIERCLTKDRKQRLADISIALFLLNDAAALAPPPAAVAAPRQKRTGLIVTTAALCLGVGAGLALVAFPANRSLFASSATTRTSLVLPADRPLAISSTTPSWILAISPDGATVAYVGLNLKAALAQRRQITLRSLGSRTTRDLPGAVGAYQPVFSPDGSWIAYFTGSGELKKVALTGGNPVTIVSKAVSNSYGSAVWVDANTIVFGGIGTGLTQVSADGSAQKTIAPLNTAEGEDRHLPLSFVPEARAVLFRTPAHLEALDLDTGKRRVVNDSPVFGEPVGDHLLFRRDEALLVAPFDRKGLALAGAAAPVAEDVLGDGPGGLGSLPQLAVSANGTLAYVPAGNAAIRVVGAVGRDSTFTPIGIDPGFLSRPRVSPDGRYVLLLRGNPGADQSVPVYDMTRGTTSFLLRNERGRIGGPVWRPPAGAQIALYLERPGSNGLYLMDLNGKEQLILKTDPSITWLRPESFSPDGSVLAYTQQKGAQFDIWTMSVADPSSARPFITAAASIHSPKFSPNGRWLAYVSSESGRSEVYVRGYPAGGSVPVSSTGSQGPVWSRDGQTLFFESGTATGPVLMSVSVTEAAGTLKLGAATVVLNQRVPSPSGGIEEYARGAVWGAEFDVFPDGRFVTQRGPDPQGFREIVLVQNWFEELKRLAPLRP